MLTRDRIRTMLSILVIVTLAIGVLSQVAGAAGKGRNGTTLSLIVLGDPVAATSATPEPHQGDDITFEVATTATDQPYVNVQCSQGGILVYDGWEGFYPAAWSDQTFTLSSHYWQSGAADCTARLVKWGTNGRQRTLATLDFHVAA